MTSNTALQPQKHQLWKNIYILNQLSSFMVHLIWILIWIKVTWVSTCKQRSFGTASRKTNGHWCNWFERFRNQSIITWWCWQTIKKGKNVSLSRAHSNARHLQVILEWKWQRLDSYVYQKQLELCLIVLVLLEGQRSKVLSWWRNVMHLLFFYQSKWACFWVRTRIVWFYLATEDGRTSCEQICL